MHPRTFSPEVDVFHFRAKKIKIPLCNNVLRSDIEIYVCVGQIYLLSKFEYFYLYIILSKNKTCDKCKILFSKFTVLFSYSRMYFLYLSTNQCLIRYLRAVLFFFFSSFYISVLYFDYYNRFHCYIFAQSQNLRSLDFLEVFPDNTDDNWNPIYSLDMP